MPAPNQKIGETAAKSGTFQYNATRIQGIPLKVPAAVVDTEVPNTRIVSIQRDASNKMFAVVSPTALASHVIIGWGVLEEALQSQNNGSISPTPNMFKDGDLVTVLSGLEDIYMIDVDPSNIPADGIATAYIDAKGRLSSVDNNVKCNGAIFTAVPGVQLSGQLKTNTKFFRIGLPFVTVEA